MRIATPLFAIAVLCAPLAAAQTDASHSTLDRAGTAAVLAAGGTFTPSPGTGTILGDNRPASLLDIGEGFNDITTLAAAGWSLQNLSAPVGTTGWFQGNIAVFPAQSGAPTSYIGANFNNAAGTGDISNWLISPQTALQNGTTLRFYTRTSPASPTTFPDRLEVRLSTGGTNTNVGTTATSVGVFTTLLLTINPTLTAGAGGYPITWTEYTATVSGLAAPTTGRFAFRYFVPNSGPTGANGTFIGIDNVRITLFPASDVYASAGAPLPIPDNNATGATSTIVVPASVTSSVIDLDVSLNITHTYVGDLRATVARGAVSSIVVDRPGVPMSLSGCPSNNIVIIADDEGTAGAIETACLGLAGAAEAYTSGGRYTPNNPLSIFDGRPVAGTWTLRVQDSANGEVGTINAWALLVTPGAPVAGEASPAASASRLSVAPNPARGTAQIDLTVGATQDVRVALYDALGREVRVLFERAVAAGQQAYIAVETSSLPAGVYVIRATGTDLNLTQRVTVVR